MVSIQTSKNQYNKEKKTTILITLIVSIYISTTVPGWMYSQTLQDDVTENQTEILDFFILIFYCNAIVNPILYASRIPVFKEVYGKIFGQIFSRGRNRVDTLTVDTRDTNVPLEPRRNNESLEPRRDVNYMMISAHM